MINDSSPPQQNNNDNTFIENKKNSQKTNNIGKGALEKSNNIKYSTEEKSVKYTNTLSSGKPEIDYPKIRQEYNFNESKKIIDESNVFFDNIQENANKFSEEVKTGKISENTKQTLNDNIELLQNTQKYMAYLSGNNLDTNEAKDIILTGMGLTLNQQKSAKILLDKNATSSQINQKHGGENSVANKISVLVNSGFNKQQARSILALSPSNNSDAILQETNQAKILKILGFNTEQIQNLKNINKPSAHPLQHELLQKMGFDNNTSKVLQAITNNELLLAQEAMIESSTAEAIWFINELISKFEAIKQPNFNNKGFNFNLSVLYASLAELTRVLNKARRTERNTKFEMSMGAVNQKLVQADLQRKAAKQAFTANMIAASASLVAAAIQVKMIAKAPPAMANAVAAKANAIGGAMNATGSAGKAVMDYEAAKTRAEEKESEALELLFNTYANESTEFINSLGSDMGKTQNTLGEIEKSNANLQRTLLGG